MMYDLQERAAKMIQHLNASIGSEIGLLLHGLWGSATAMIVEEYSQRHDVLKKTGSLAGNPLP